MGRKGTRSTQGGGRPRFRIEKATLLEESEGPDYFSRGEFLVKAEPGGEIVARFPWSLEEAYMAPKLYSGPQDVRIAEDGSEAIARDDEGKETRVLLPGATIAIAFDGVPVAPDTDVGTLARRIAAEGGPPNPKGWREPGGQWLWRLWQRLGKSPAGTKLPVAIAALLDDTDPRVRGQVLRFYHHAGAAPGCERVLDLCETRRESFGIRHPGSQPGESLDDDLVRALIRFLREDPPMPRARDAARREALAPGRREDLLRALMESDRAFVLDSAAEIARSATDRWQELLLALARSEDGEIGRIAALVASAGIAAPASVRTFARERIANEETRDLVSMALAATGARRR